MPKINTNPEKIKELLTRGVEEIHVRESLEKKLQSGKQLRIKFGTDPTGAKLHVGRMSAIWKLREFQDLGHQIVLIIGDYTAQIGDASDKLAKRPFLSVSEVKKNMATYKQQIGKVLDVKKVEWHYNSKWLGKLKPRELDELAELFSVQQMIARRNFKDRWEKQEEISLRELHYPLYQGYDSIMVKADVEIGGSDQLFNLLAGRKIQEAYGQKPQDVVTGSMIDGLDGWKMSTSWGNVITVMDEPNDMYGKLMSMRDELVGTYADLVARMDLSVVADVKKRITQGENPRDLKMMVAKATVALYHGEKLATKAEEAWKSQFQEHAVPEHMPLLEVAAKEVPIVELVIAAGFATSKTEARRLIEQNGIKVAGVVINEVDAKIELAHGEVIMQKGKRYFVRVKQQ